LPKSTPIRIYFFMDGLLSSDAPALANWRFDAEKGGRPHHHCEQSEAIQTKPRLEPPSLDRFALLAMTKSAP
jgi:hypothetical protein